MTSILLPRREPGSAAVSRQSAQAEAGGRRGVGGGCDFGDEVGERAAHTGGTAGKAAVVSEGIVSDRNREFLVKHAGAGEAERFA